MCPPFSRGYGTTQVEPLELPAWSQDESRVSAACVRKRSKRDPLMSSSFHAFPVTKTSWSPAARQTALEFKASAYHHPQHHPSALRIRGLNESKAKRAPHTFYRPLLEKTHKRPLHEAWRRLPKRSLPPRPRTCRHLLLFPSVGSTRSFRGA